MLTRAVLELISEQKRLQEVIKTLIQTGKTTKQLEEAWLKFEANNLKIIKSSTVFDHQYFAENIFGNLEVEYKKMMKKEDNDLALKESKPASTNVPQAISSTNVPQTISPATNTRECEMANDLRLIKIRMVKANLIILKTEDSLLRKNMLEMLTNQKRLAEIWSQVLININALEVKGYNIEDGLEEFQTLEDKMFEIRTELEMEIENIKSSKPIPLPEPRLPKFNGFDRDWPSFSSEFGSLVHDRLDLSDAVKFQYLKSSLYGEAKAMVQHMMLGTDANYEETWNMLVERYENKRKLFSCSFDQLLDLPNLDGEIYISVKKYISTINECSFIIKDKAKIGRDVDVLLAHIVLRKFNGATLQQYEHYTKKTKDIQTLEDVKAFLEQLCVSLASTQSRRKTSQYANNPRTSEQNCKFCKMDGHNIMKCRKFGSISADDRKKFINKEKLCYKCFQHDSNIKCTKEVRCDHCNRTTHSTLMHQTYNKTPTDKVATNITHGIKKDTVLATAMIKVRTIDGSFELLRALMDSGSQATIMSEETAQLLRLPRRKTKTQISGISSSQVEMSKHKVLIEVRPRFTSDFFVKVEAFVLPNLNKTLPNKSFEIDRSDWENCLLADPHYNKVGRIDLILGADVYPEIMDQKNKRIGGMLAQETKLGWIISGNIRKSISNKVVSATTTINELNLERFWEMEEDETDVQQIENQICEQYFADTTTVDTDGRFIVSIPFKEDTALGDSKKQAVARLLSMERKFKKNFRLKEEYSKFMDDYLQLGHMVPTESGKEGLYYMPHQAVLREGSATTKLRVVFDASATTSNGLSLNDVMLVGPRLQRDIFDIITKWRKWKYALTADIEKMYRQVKISTEDQRYQHILWRSDRSKKIEEFTLTTVTYGTAAAPYLAVRALQETAKNTENEELRLIIKEDFYMDDLLTGSDSMANCKGIYTDLKTLLLKSGFHLRKWMSNCEEIKDEFSNDVCNEVMQINENEAVKTLGLQWEPASDSFMFTINVSEGKITKRFILSTLAKIFDPLGWLSPTVITGKLLIQQLWVDNKKWDEELDQQTTKVWCEYVKQLPTLDKITVGDHGLQLHGFSDASEKAFAAVVYAKVGETVSIIAAKTKVNPIKNRKTIPKLELCAAQLLAKLMDRVRLSIQNTVKTYVWCDSKVALAWIKNDKNKEKFIRTRVQEIKERLPNVCWNYIKSDDNPADVASRGISPNQLEQHQLWWGGPSWLKDSEYNWPQHEEEKYEERLLLATILTPSNPFTTLLQKFSCIHKLDKVMAYVLRFVGKLRKVKYPELLTVDELKSARLQAIKHHQRIEFGHEIRCLENKKELGTKVKILPLGPFLDKEGVLRVGGRLHNSSLPYSMKHPIILNKSEFATLFVHDAHKATLHGGVKLMRTYIQGHYWIIGLTNVLKRQLRSCVICTRYRQEAAHQIMGNLPICRVDEAFPFKNTGIDYAGPIKIRCSKGRGMKTYKGYIAVFVCMATKAIHLEAVSDLSTETFMAALRRFFARRGKSSNLYSDNGTNFVGAARKLDEDLRKAIKGNTTIAASLIAEGIQWHFIPPVAPHFGGIWEAGVKSVKYHLKRIIGDNNFTFEEMSTLLHQIEAVLNSRPLYDIGTNTDEIDVLTPGHFLIGRTLLSMPEPLPTGNIGTLDRWKLIQRLRTDFWRKWKEEYLTTLQYRNKWMTAITNLQKGQIVLLKGETTHPAKWPMGRIDEVHPGADGRVRVVTIKTQDGTFKRSVTKVCPLATEENTLNQDENKRIRNLREPIKSSTSAVLALMSLMILQVSSAALGKSSDALESSVQSLNDSTAIYLQSMGQVDIMSSTWNMVIYFEMNPFFEAIDESQGLLREMFKLCSKLDLFESQCTNVLTNMQHRLEVIIESNELFVRKKAVREKRAALPIVGSFMHILFGVMDDDDRVALENNMNNLLENQHDIRDLAKNQTSLVDSTLNILKRTTEDVNKQFIEMHGRIKNITTVLNENYLVYRESIKFFMVTKQLEDMVEEVEKIQTQIINLLIDVNHGSMNPALLKPHQLKEEILHVREYLSDKLILPGKRSGNQLTTIYHLMKSKGIFMGTKLAIHAKLPLVTRHPSHLYKLIPIPIEKGKVRVSAKISTPYLIYNLELDAYHQMDQLTLNQCDKDLAGQIICKGGWPWLDANDNSCEISALKPDTQNNCVYQEVKRSPFWVQLNSNNKWLFKIFNKSSAYMDCSGSKQRLLRMPLLGIFTLAAGCTARVDGVTLISPLDIQTEDDERFEAYHVKEVNGTFPFITPLEFNTIQNNEDVEMIKEHIKELRSNSIHFRGLAFHHTTVIYR